MRGSTDVLKQIEVLNYALDLAYAFSEHFGIDTFSKHFGTDAFSKLFGSHGQIDDQPDHWCFALHRVSTEMTEEEDWTETMLNYPSSSPEPEVTPERPPTPQDSARDSTSPGELQIQFEEFPEPTSTPQLDTSGVVPEAPLEAPLEAALEASLEAPPEASLEAPLEAPPAAPPEVPSIEPTASFAENPRPIDNARLRSDGNAYTTSYAFPYSGFQRYAALRNPTHFGFNSLPTPGGFAIPGVGFQECIRPVDVSQIKFYDPPPKLPKPEGKWKCTFVNITTNEPCPKRFSNKGNRQRHEEEQHAPQTGSFKCPSCDECFARAGTLHRHIQAVHNKGGRNRAKERGPRQDSETN